MFCNSSSLDLLEQNTYDKYDIQFDGNRYTYNGHNLPRVTEILSSMLHEDYLMNWANSIGLYQHKEYEKVLQDAANKGSYTHESIENLVKHNKELDIDTIPREYRYSVYNAYMSFKKWWSIVTSKHKVEVLFQEEKLVCEWFGGTLDMLVKIDGVIYLVDFKTSNHPSYKYFLQMGAYQYMLKLRGIDIDGVIILVLNKNAVSFNELILNFIADINDKLFMDYCQEAFMSLVYAYYNRLYIQNLYNNKF